MLTAILIAYPGNFVRIESTELARASGYRVLQTITQKFLLRSKFGIGSGKVEEVTKSLSLEKPDYMMISAKTGLGLYSLKSKIITRLGLTNESNVPLSTRVNE